LKSVEEILDSYGIEYQDLNADNYKFVCPFHDDINPSLSMRKDNGVFFCFGCGEKGDLITFIQKYEKISYDEARKKVYGDNIKIEVKPFKKKKKEYSFENRYKDLRMLMELLLYTDTWVKRTIDSLREKINNEGILLFEQRYNGLVDLGVNWLVEMKRSLFEYVIDYIEEHYIGNDKYYEFLKLCEEYKLLKELRIAKILYDSEEYKREFFPIKEGLTDEERKLYTRVLRKYLKML